VEDGELVLIGRLEEIGVVDFDEARTACYVPTRIADG
jgi:hypothetical protein